jgi:antitoxin MazE
MSGNDRDEIFYRQPDGGKLAANNAPTSGCLRIEPSIISDTGLNVTRGDNRRLGAASVDGKSPRPQNRVPGSAAQNFMPRRALAMVIHWRYGARMVKKLTKHGNSLALVIDRPILDLLRIDPETPLDVSTDGKRLIVAPAKPSERRKKFEEAQEWAHKRYGKAFQKLAE